MDLALAGPPFGSTEPVDCAADLPEFRPELRRSLHRNDPGCVVGEHRQVRGALQGLHEGEPVQYSMDGKESRSEALRFCYCLLGGITSMTYRNGDETTTEEIRLTKLCGLLVIIQSHLLKAIRWLSLEGFPNLEKELRVSEPTVSCAHRLPSTEAVCCGGRAPSVHNFVDSWHLFLQIRAL